MEKMLVAYLHMVAFSLLLCWILLDFVESRRRRRRRRPSMEAGETGQVVVHKRTRIMAETTVACNILISILYLGFCIHGVWKPESISSGHVLSTMSWLLVTLYATYCKPKRAGGWPPVLVSWWVFSSLLHLISVSVYLISLWNKTSLRDTIPAASAVEFISFPVSVFLCFAALSMCSSKTNLDLKQHLLSNDGACAGRDYFSRAGFWSRLTFRWLNPVFEKGRAERLELAHIPGVPPSETAESSFSLLQESLRDQKTESASLLKAIIHAVWRPLAVNAVFAGLNTCSSYLGPFLITNLVEFISGEDSSHGRHYGYMLACLFFSAKTVESLTQRHWYFGARQIGIRVRAALMVAVFNKSLPMKHSGSSMGKIINFLDVDVERIGDFFWYIHGLWLLPVQVSLALLILYRNLGAAASFSVLAVTILVMVSNTPLANLQERLHFEQATPT